jgi:hypothetical protein
MYKVLLVVSLLLSTNVNAGTWKLLNENDEGGRLLVDVDSAVIDTYDKDGKGDGTRVRAHMRYIEKDGELFFVGVIDGAECITQQGGALVNLFEDNTSKTYFWSDLGNRLYDSEGRWLCGYLIDVLETMAEKPQRAAPKIYM